jgi:hypothetical protein
VETQSQPNAIGGGPYIGNPPSPFKMNPKWLKEEDFIQKIKESWTPFDDTLNESTTIQFHQNLKKVKQDGNPMVKREKRKG